MKNKWFWGILIVTILSWVGNIVYFESHQLKEPVVLDAVIDIQASEHTNISLYYLTNSSEVIELETLIASGHTYDNEQNFFPWFGDVTAQSYRRQYTHQFLKQASFTFDQQSLQQLVKGVETNDLFARFTNGQVVPVQLEKLNLQPLTKETNFLVNSAEFGSDQGIHGSVLQATEAVTMDKIELPNSLLDQAKLKVQISSSSSPNEEVEKIMNTKWEEIDAPLHTDIEWPLNLKKDDAVVLIFRLQNSDTYIDSVFNWTGITDSKKAFTYSLPLQMEPSLEKQDVVEIVQKVRRDKK